MRMLTMSTNETPRADIQSETKIATLQRESPLARLTEKRTL